MKLMPGLNDTMTKPEASLSFSFFDIICNYEGALVHCGLVKVDTVSC